MKKQFVILYLSVSLFTFGSCSDVEGIGKPEPQEVRIEVESTDYYVQITQDNIEETAFVFRWLNMNEASQYILTLSSEEYGEETINVPDKSILTYNNVREQLFENREIIGYLERFNHLVCGSELSFTITLKALNTEGASITSEASKTATIHVLIDSELNLTTN